MSQVYVVTETIVKRFTTKGEVLTCARCKQDLMVGDAIFSRPSGFHGRKRKRYHVWCWKSMLYPNDKR